MAQLFHRRAAVTVHDRRFESERYDGARRIPGLRIKFDIEQSIESTANKAEVEISNLSSDSRGRIQVKRPQFLLEAGYEETFASIFKGEATHIINERQGAEFVTKVSAADGLEAQRGIVNASLAPGASVAQVIQAITKTMGVGSANVVRQAQAGNFDGALRTFFNGISLSGSSKEEMDRLARSVGFDWSIQDGELQVLLPNDTTTEQAVVLSPSTGLIDVPHVVIDKKHHDLSLVGAKSMLQPKLRVGRRVELRSAELSGSFKITRVKHRGDTHAADWISECEMVKV